MVNCEASFIENTTAFADNVSETIFYVVVYCVASDAAVVHCQTASVENSTTFAGNVSGTISYVVVYSVASDDAVAQGKNAFIGDRAPTSGIFVAIGNSQPVDCRCYTTGNIKNTISTIILNS